MNEQPKLFILEFLACLEVLRGRLISCLRNSFRGGEHATGHNAQSQSTPPSGQPPPYVSHTSNSFQRAYIVAAPCRHVKQIIDDYWRIIRLMIKKMSFAGQFRISSLRSSGIALATPTCTNTQQHGGSLVISAIGSNSFRCKMLR